MRLEKMLPIGSVVCLNGSRFLLMIIGCNQVNGATRQLFDYSGVIFPMGYTDERHIYMFDHKDITTIYAVGLLDDESRAFQSQALEENSKLRSGAMTVSEFLGAGR